MKFSGDKISKSSSKRFQIVALAFVPKTTSATATRQPTRKTHTCITRKKQTRNFSCMSYVYVWVFIKIRWATTHQPTTQLKKYLIVRKS